MSNASFFGLLQNAIFLLVLGWFFDSFILRTNYEKALIKVLSGVFIGGLGITVMVVPWEFRPGIYFDTRTIVMSLSGLFFGIIPTTVAMAIASVFRLVQGGDGAICGVGLVISSGLLGLAWRKRNYNRLDEISHTRLFIFGVIVHVVMLILVATLPSPSNQNILARIVIPVMILYPIGTVFVGRLLISRILRKKTNDELKASESRWRSLTEDSPDNIITLDRDLKVEFINYSLSGEKREAMMGKPLLNFVSRDERQESIRETLIATLTDGKQRVYETSFFTLTGELKFYDSTVVPRKITKNGSIIGLTITSRDITPRKVAEDSLRESQAFLSTLINSLPDLVWLKDKEGIYLACNQRFAAFSGKNQSELVGKSDYEIVDKDLADFFRKNDLLAMSAGKATINEEELTYASDGHKEVVETVKTPIFDEDNQLMGVLGIARDITERKRIEQQLQASLQEKEILLQEVHHRVKNNIQVIASMLKLQLRYKDKKDIETLIKENIGRVFTMSMIHESLYRSETLSEIDFEVYVQKLCRVLSQTFLENPGQITFQVSCPDIKIHIDKANPLGLVLNELISNSLKYAFQGKDNGIVRINATISPEEKQITLNVADDGIGIPDDFDLKSAKSLGLVLIKQLIETQLDGTIKFHRQNGTLAVIKIPA